MKRLNLASFRRRAKQRGVVLIISLIVLVAMIMASVALVRSVDITTQIAGNLAYRQSGVQAGDVGVEIARRWLTTIDTVTLANGLPTTYFASWDGGVKTEPKVFDPKTFDWKQATTIAKEQDTGNTIEYVIHRMCDKPGDPTTLSVTCHSALTQLTSGPVGIVGGETPSCRGNCKVSNIHPFYRITVKVSGPRNTVTYVQAVVY